MIIFTFGETVYSPNSSAVVADLSDEASRSTYFGAFNLHGFGSFLGPPLGAFFFVSEASLLPLYYLLYFLISTLLLFFSLKLLSVKKGNQ